MAGPSPNAPVRGVRLGRWIAALAALAAPLAAAPAQTTGLSLPDLATTGPGLCVHLGAGRADAADLTAELARRSRMLVHGLALDEQARQRAWQAIEAAALAGQASVQTGPVAPLPYLRHLATQVVIDDWPSLGKAGLSMDDVDRITAPGGVICVRGNGVWTHTVKPRPAEMDDWPYPSHGPDGNWVSRDRLVRFPLGLRWADGLPVNLTGFTDCRAWVSAGGRLFTLGINEPENLGRPVEAGKTHYAQYLTARNAFNGLPLWKLNCRTGDDGLAVNWTNLGALAVEGDYVYTVVDGNQVAKIAAATGQVVWTAQASHPIFHLLVLDGRVVTANWGKTERVWYVWKPLPEGGTVEAFDTTTGRRAWKADLTAWQMVAGNGAVYLQLRTDGPPRIVAVKLADGKELWDVRATEGTAPDVSLLVAGEGFLALRRAMSDRQARLEVVSAEDGRPLFDPLPLRTTWTPLVEGLLWADGKKLDPRTGQVKGAVGAWLGGHTCTPRAIVGSYAINARDGGYLELPDAAGAATKARPLRYMAARSACVGGMVPANGMLYTAQNKCRCVPGHLYGFLAIGPRDDEVSAEEFTAPRPLEKGPAYGTPLAEPAAAGQAWPTLLANAQRSSGVGGTLAAELRPLWVSDAPAPAPAAMAMAWEGQLTWPISPPVVAEGLLVVARTDRGQLQAYAAATGRLAWTVALDSRIDGPPTLYRGYCLVGCHDGFLYALRARDGQRAWRARIAPRAQWTVAWGRVESLWPVAASVLVRDDVVYATAGRSTESDGGIAVAALDVATGATRWARPLGSPLQRLNDILAWRDGQLAWRYVRLDPADGRMIVPTSMPALQLNGGGAGRIEGGLADGSYTVVENRRGGGAFTIGEKVFDVLAWNARQRVGPRGDIADDGQPGTWRQGLPGRVMGLALTDDAAIYLLRSTPLARPDAKGSLVVVSSTDGARRFSAALEAPPVYQGLAISDGRTYVTLANGKIACFGP